MIKRHASGLEAKKITDDETMILGRAKGGLYIFSYDYEAKGVVPGTGTYTHRDSLSFTREELEWVCTEGLKLLKETP